VAFGFLSMALEAVLGEYVLDILIEFQLYCLQVSQEKEDPREMYKESVFYSNLLSMKFDACLWLGQ
jgi:hypothetical protein